MRRNLEDLRQPGPKQLDQSRALGCILRLKAAWDSD